MPVAARAERRPGRRGRPGAGRRGATRSAGGRRTRPACAASPTLRPSSLGERLERLAERGLGDEVERALGERVHGVGAVRGGEGGDHDDRHRLGLAVAQRPQHAEAVEAGHVQVEREGVRAGARGTARAPRRRRRRCRRRRSPDAAARRRACGASAASRRRRRRGWRPARWSRDGPSVPTRRRARRAPARPAKRPSGLSRMTRRSPILAIASIVSVLAVGTGSSWLASVVRTSSTSSTMTPTWPVPVSRMTILPGSLSVRRARAVRRGRRSG